MDVRLANPRGFCAGVDRAIEVVEKALEVHGKPVYVLHEIVHNRYVVEDLSSRGVVFVNTLEEVPKGSVTIFSAHGVSEAVVKAAEGRGLRVFDATCPLVTKVHLQAQGYHERGRHVILIGHPGHPEVEGTRGRIEGPVTVLSTVEEVEALERADAEKLAYVTQPTLSIDDTREVIEALVKRFPRIQGPELKDICYATQNRQNAVRRLAEDGLDVLIVIGSKNSSNSTRLAELGKRKGVRSFLIDDASEIRPEWFGADGSRNAARVGVTAGASAPESLVKKVIERLRELGAGKIEEMPGELETVEFKLPSELGAA
jgi:4-hydroxy-3-methylbut-2-enyl diphosphate reductase